MKKIVLVILLFTLPFGVAGAASLNGDFEGNPIVRVQSNGQNLQIDEVPAIIYKGNTVVPISMLRQLGATVSWDASTYSVNVALPQSTAVSPSAKQLEFNRLTTTYQWLKDTDSAILAFAQQLQQYARIEDGKAYSNQMDKDYEELNNLYNESMQLSLKVIEQVSSFNELRSIILSQSNVLASISQTKSMLQYKFSGINIPDFEKVFNVNILNIMRDAQKNLNQTNAILHKLQVEGILNLPPTTTS